MTNKFNIEVIICFNTAKIGISINGFICPGKYTMFMNAMRLLDSYLETALVGGAGVAIDALTVLLIYALGDEQYGEPLVWPIITLIFAIGATWSVIENATLKYRLDFGERTEGRFASDAGKKMVIFLLCAFGVNFAMLPIMHYGYVHEINLSVFMFAQMMYPMCGVMLGKMFSYNEKKQPHSVYIIFIRHSIKNAAAGRTVPQRRGYLCSASNCLRHSTSAATPSAGMAL